MVEFKATSHVALASPRIPNTKSIKTTVPKAVVEYLKLKTTDVLEWTAEKGNVVTVKNLGTPQISYKKG